MIAAFTYSQLFHLLEMNESKTQWMINSDVMDWIDENNIDVQEKLFLLEDETRQRYGLYFSNNIDYVAFKLRWM